MALIALVVVGLSMEPLLCIAALAQPVDDAAQVGDGELYRHIDTSEPRLPNLPARRENISDDEVREVQAAALEVYPDSIVVISGVTEGCACEEGGQCSAQVGLALYRDYKVHSLILSKVNGHWKIGAVQSWWLQYAKNHTDSPGFRNMEARRAWQEKEDGLLKSFPACPLPPAHWMLLRTNQFGSIFFDKSSMTVSGSIRRLNFKRVNTPPQRTGGLPWVLFSIYLAAYDCQEHRVRSDETTSYFNDGSATRLSVNTSVLWDPIRPGTDQAADLEMICSWKTKESP